MSTLTVALDGLAAAAPGDPPTGLVHVDLQPDRQTQRAVCRAQGIQPGAASRPGFVEVGQHPEVTNNDILAADAPGTTQGQ